MNNESLNKLAVKLGTFLFKYRNKVFPIIVVALFLLAAPIKSVDNETAELFSNKDLLALAIVLLGLIFRGVVIGFAYIKRGGLNKKVYADKLVTEGLFTICRNPLYVGNMLICIGLFLLHQYFLVGLLGMLLYFGIYQCIILTEENYLRDKFGESYQIYCQKTPRWIPKFLEFPNAISGMSFNFRRVIIKDYSTISTAFVTFLVIKTYQSWLVTTPSQTANYIFLIIFVGIFAAAIRVLKKKQLIKE